jgi:hypothetical protein
VEVRRFDSGKILLYCHQAGLIYDDESSHHITQGMIGVAWRLPERNPETGVAMRKNGFANVCCSFFIE